MLAATCVSLNSSTCVGLNSSTCVSFNSADLAMSCTRPTNTTKRGSIDFLMGLRGLAARGMLT